MKNALFRKLREGKVVLGVCNMYPAAGIIEGMCQGWDFVWIDGQHGQHSYETIMQAIRTADFLGVASVVRVPGHAADFLGRIADLSPSSVMIPMVNSLQEAKAIVEALRFAPLGKRSYGSRRVIDLQGRQYYQQQEMLIMPQIETLEALEVVDVIADTEGVDCLFFGPDDMRVQLGLPINTAIQDSGELQEAMRKTAKAAQKSGKFLACPASTAETIKIAVDLGYQMLVGGGDSAFLRTASQAKLTEIRHWLHI